jgi:hypothetical protein
MRITATSPPAHGAGSWPTAVGDSGCREGPIRPPGPAITGLRIRSACRAVGATTRRRPVRPSWVGSCVRSAHPGPRRRGCDRHGDGRGRGSALWRRRRSIEVASISAGSASEAILASSYDHVFAASAVTLNHESSRGAGLSQIACS